MTHSIQQRRERIVAFREALRAGRPLIGSFAALPSPGFVEALGHSGLDFLVIDTEHGPAGPETVETLLRAADASGTLAFVRVPAQRPDLVSRIMDSGAAGIMLPMVETTDNLDQAHNAMRFPPAGRRGVAPSVRAGGYGFLSMPDFVRWSNEETVLIAQIETGLAVDNVDALVAHPAVDAAFIGTADLSTSLGFPGKTKEPVVAEAIDKVVTAAKTAGMPVGSIALSPDMAIEWLEKGVNLIVLSSTIGFRGYQNQLQAINAATGA